MFFRKSLAFIICLPFIAVASVSQYRLGNGLDVIVKQDHRSPVVISTLWYRVGGSYEHDGITGLSHILEHMMFQGTKHIPAGKFSELINEEGGVLNAVTSNDYTEYFEEMAANKLDLSFRLEADRMHNLIIDQTRFDRELKVVKEERYMRVDDNPFSRTFERLNALSFVNSPYHNPVIGWPSDLNSIKMNDAKRWYRSWYMPNNAILIVVGDVEPTNVLRLAKKYFGPLKPGKTPLLKPRYEVKPVGEKQIDVSLPGNKAAVLIAYHVPSLLTVKGKGWQAYALDVLSSILGEGSSSRLERDLVRNKQVASSVGSSYDLLTLHEGAFTVFAIPVHNSSLKQVQKALLSEIKQLKTSLVAQKEINRVKATVIANKVFSMDSLSRQASELGRYAVIGLPISDADDYVKNIEKVTPKQIIKVANLYFDKDNLSIARFEPTNNNNGGQT